MSDLKLFVWEDVFYDYGSGLAFGGAHNPLALR